jgi:hypothetical protein
MKEVKLTQGYVALVDDEDFDRVSKCIWVPNPCRSRNTVYAQRNFYKEDGKRSTQSLHRFILGVTDSKVEIDHKDNNGLNCQKYNMRVSTHSQNQANSTLRITNTSGLKGVYRYSERKWKAQINFQGKKISLGYFNNKEEAKEVYNLAAVSMFGEFAKV